MDLPNLQETDTPFLVHIILERKKKRREGRKRRKGVREEMRRQVEERREGKEGCTKS